MLHGASQLSNFGQVGVNQQQGFACAVPRFPPGFFLKQLSIALFTAAAAMGMPMVPRCSCQEIRQLVAVSSAHPWKQAPLARSPFQAGRRPHRLSIAAPRTPPRAVILPHKQTKLSCSLNIVRTAPLSTQRDETSNNRREGCQG